MIMTQENKVIIYKDLCARLQYGVLVNIEGYGIHKLTGIDGNTISTNSGINYPLYLVKPYLRPMSSMTEEEKKELKNLFDAEEVTSDSICYLEGGTLVEYLSHISYSFCSEIIDWLNVHHFDYRKLIEKGLAIEATEGMYK